MRKKIAKNFNNYEESVAKKQIEQDKNDELPMQQARNPTVVFFSF